MFQNGIQETDISETIDEKKNGSMFPGLLAIAALACVFYEQMVNEILSFFYGAHDLHLFVA